MSQNLLQCYNVLSVHQPFFWAFHNYLFIVTSCLPTVYYTNFHSFVSTCMPFTQRYQSRHLRFALTCVWDLFAQSATSSLLRHVVIVISISPISSFSKLIKQGRLHQVLLHVVHSLYIHRLKSLIFAIKNTFTAINRPL